MNVNNIIEMIKEDPSIVDDIPNFLKKVNEKNMTLATRRHIEVIDEEVMISIADRCGGDATEQNVLEAVQLMSAEPLIQRVKDDHEILKQAILSGECKTPEEIKTKVVELADKAIADKEGEGEVSEVVVKT